MSQPKPKRSTRRKKQRSRWGLIALLAGGLLLIFGAIFVLNQPSKPKAEIEVSGAPSLKVNKEIVDLGEVKLGQTVTVSFELTNVGDQPLRFTKPPYIEVKEGC